MKLPGVMDDTNQVRREFNGLSRSTHILIASLVALGILLGLLLGGLLGYGVAVEEVEGRDCIEHEDVLYCADEDQDEAP